MKITFSLLLAAGVVLAVLKTGCTPTEPNKLDELGTVSMKVNGQSFQLWIADDHNERTRGLMFVTAEEMAALPDGTRRGMLFVFDYEQPLTFWMRNTIIPLDIAYLDDDRKIVAMYTMAALDDRAGQYPSRSPARFAVEVEADVWRELGLEVGDTLEIPPEALNR